MLPKFGLEQGEYTAAPAEMTNRMDIPWQAPESLEEAKQDLAGLDMVDYLLTDTGLLVMGKHTVYPFALTASQAFEPWCWAVTSPSAPFRPNPAISWPGVWERSWTRCGTVSWRPTCSASPPRDTRWSSWR